MRQSLWMWPADGSQQVPAVSGRIHQGQGGLPFSSTLRVYEPLSSFPEHYQAGLSAAAAQLQERSAIDAAEVQASLGRITRPNGDPFPSGRTDGIRITTADGTPPSAEHGATDLLYCPNQLVLRAGLAANSLMEGIHGPLAELLIPEDVRERHQARIDAVTADDSAHLIHSRASTWGIPFAWFSLFMETDRKDVVEADGRILTVRVWTSMTQARERARYAAASLALAAPDLDMLDDLTQLSTWLDKFGAGAMLELDYGAVADRVHPDDSPMDIRLGIECLAEGDMTGAAAAYRRLASRWIPIRQLARAS